jgi:hypothetical protein
MTAWLKELTRDIAKGPILVPFIIIMIAYWLVAWSLSGSIMSEVVNGMLFGVSVMVAWAYGPGALASIRAREINRVEHLMLGIALAWVATGLSRLWVLMLINLNRPEWMIGNHILPFIYFLIVLAGILHLTAPANVPDAAGRMHTNWWYVVAALIIGLVFTTAVMLLL